jgi:hypothetical protein
VSAFGGFHVEKRTSLPGAVIGSYIGSEHDVERAGVAELLPRLADARPLVEGDRGGERVGVVDQAVRSEKSMCVSPSSNSVASEQQAAMSEARDPAGKVSPSTPGSANGVPSLRIGRAISNCHGS